MQCSAALHLQVESKQGPFSGTFYISELKTPNFTLIEKVSDLFFCIACFLGTTNGFATKFFGIGLDFLTWHVAPPKRMNSNYRMCPLFLSKSAPTSPPNFPAYTATRATKRTQSNGAYLSSLPPSLTSPARAARKAHSPLGHLV